MSRADQIRQALDVLQTERPDEWHYDKQWLVLDAAREFADWLEGPTDEDIEAADVFVAEALYEEYIAWSVDVDARGGPPNASSADWPSWDELGPAGVRVWLGMAVTARVALEAVRVRKEQT